MDTIFGNRNTKYYLKNVKECLDGGYILSVITEKEKNSGEKLKFTWLLKTNDLGSTIWERPFIDSSHHNISSLIVSKYGGFYVFVYGKPDKPSRGTKQRHVYKLNNLGEILWTKTIEVRERNAIIYSIKENIDGSLIGCGSIPHDYTMNIPVTNGYLLKISKEGELLWERLHSLTGFMDGNYDELLDIAPTTNGGYLACGYGSNWRVGIEGNYWVIKTDSRGCVGDACDLIGQSKGWSNSGIPDLEMFPIPSDQLVNFQLHDTPTNLAELKIFDRSGKLVHYLNLENGIQKFSIDVSTFNNGVYFVKFNSPERSFPAQKLVIQH